MATPTKAARTVVASGSNTAGSTTRGTVDLRTTFGGTLYMKITNGGTGPTVECRGNVLGAVDSGSTPAAGSAGSVWKTITTFGGGSVNNAVTEYAYEVSAGLQHLEVEFTGNTAQTVTVEASFSEISSIA